MKHTKELHTLISLMVTSACLSFVLYQSNECWLKYCASPKSTDVSIQKAELYPEVTICPHNLQIYTSFLQSCNLTYQNYFSQYRWTGNGSCKDPKVLWNSMVGTINDFIMFVNIFTHDDLIRIDLKNQSHFKVQDGLKGRCYTLIWLPHLELTSLQMFVKHEATVYIHAPGESFGSDVAEVTLYNNTVTKIKLLYETFEVLDYSGEACLSHSVNESRDDCIYEAIQKESMETIGCTAPFIPDKSNICTYQTQATKANSLFENVTKWTQTKATRLCPRPCKQYIISFGNKDTSHAKSPMPTLKLEFPKFIKVSKSSFSYTILELIAEVGGYVGLFLGVSINQISDLFRITCQKCSQKCIAYSK